MPALLTKRNWRAETRWAYSITGPTTSRSFPLLSTTCPPAPHRAGGSAVRGAARAEAHPRELMQGAAKSAAHGRARCINVYSRAAGVAPVSESALGGARTTSKYWSGPRARARSLGSPQATLTGYLRLRSSCSRGEAGRRRGWPPQQAARRPSVLGSGLPRPGPGAAAGPGSLKVRVPLRHASKRRLRHRGAPPGR